MKKEIVRSILAAGLFALAITAGNTQLKAAELPENGWYEENGMKYWYENGIRQGTEGRGKEIFDPESNAWYWLDAVQGGAKATSKDVYQQVQQGSYEDGVDEIGKWVRYDEDGRMIKGFQTTEAGIYYFDPETGAMLKDSMVMNGKVYYFDFQTGIGFTGWVEYVNANPTEFAEAGRKYWYDDGIRQGMEGRGKEIFDPYSKAWYWLDSVQNGGIATDKDVYQESWAGEFADREDGTGKWVRYDIKGHMIKGWNTITPRVYCASWDEVADDAIAHNAYDTIEYDSEVGSYYYRNPQGEKSTYYFDPVTGAMVKGTIVIDGKTYKFDESTGVLLNE